MDIIIAPETGTRPPKLRTGTITHDGLGAVVTCSSTHLGEPGEGPPAALVDGKFETRWSSEYSAPQQVVVDLGEVMPVASLRLHWESASALRYIVSVSRDMREWEKIHLCLNTRASNEPRVDEVRVKDRAVRGIKLDLLARASPDWGFSLYEVEVVASD
jgi:hypothetical protein